MATMEELARRIVAAAQKCEDCGAVATKRYTDAKRKRTLCKKHCKRQAFDAATSAAIGPDGFDVSDIPEGEHAAEVAAAYGIEGAK